MKDGFEIAFAVIIALFVMAIGIMIGGSLESNTGPTKYANGYCTALGGERINDETCNVDGKVVVIP